MNPQTHGWPALTPSHHLHARPAPLGATPMPAQGQHPPPPPPLAALPASRTETDVQWIVGWLRDLLVIAMAITNLLHAGGGH